VRILVVEDDADVREALCDILADAGHQVVGAGTGAEAIEHLRKGCRGSLVFLDLHLPDTAGDQLAQRIRADRDLACSEIVMMTALSTSPPVPGTAGTFKKPFNVDKLLEFVEKHSKPD